MKRKLLFTLSVFTFITVLSINFSGSLKNNRQGTKLETLNIVAMANAEGTCECKAPLHNPLFGSSWCENLNEYSCYQ